jgi:2-isopropylmalate synthase
MTTTTSLTPALSADQAELIYDWNEVKRRGRVFPKNVELCDETLRDGIQSPSVVDPSIEIKKELIELMDSLGITVANIGLPGAGQRAVDDVKALAMHIRDRRLQLGATCAARTVQKDIEPIVRVRDEVGLPITAYTFGDEPGASARRRVGYGAPVALDRRGHLLRRQKHPRRRLRH